jgi:hypothetical protein
MASAPAGWLLHRADRAARELNKSLPIVTASEASEELGRRGFGNLHPLGPWESLARTWRDLYIQRLAELPQTLKTRSTNYILLSLQGAG